MKKSNILGVAAWFSLAHALPTANIPPPVVSVTFNGAAGASYSILVPLDNTPVETNNALSISSISSTYDIAEYCTLSTVDYPPALVEGPVGTWVVGPPQTVISISCCPAVNTPPPVYITIDFIGAADAQYELSVPLDGTFVPTNNALSISTLESTYAGLPSCTFQYIDGEAALVEIAANTFAVGPPQTITGVQCG